MANRTRKNSTQSIFFLNITRRQAISHVAKFCHVLGHGSMIKLMVFIFIKCFLANQNQLFYIKVKLHVFQNNSILVYYKFITIITNQTRDK